MKLLNFIELCCAIAVLIAVPMAKNRADRSGESKQPPTHSHPSLKL